MRTNNYSGFVFETHDGYIMHFLPPSHSALFQFTKELEKKYFNIEIDVIQNTEIYKIDLVPESVVEIFDTLIKKM